jgi:hypothetical protein
MLHNSFFNKKALSSILLFILCGTLYGYPKKTEAVWNTDWLNLVQNTVSAIGSVPTAVATGITAGGTTGLLIKETFGDGLANIIAKQILRRITAQTVNWINSGFEGNPAFVTDPQRFFLGMADQTASQLFLGANSPLNQLCSPFKAEVRLALVKNYLSDRDPQQYQCTFEKIGANFENFTKDFSQGGWDAWFTMTQQYQNNPYGAYIEGQKTLSVQIQTQQGIKQRQLAEGKGFLSYERCRRDYVPPKTAPKCTKYEPLTAGGGEPKCLVFEEADASGEVTQCPASEKEVVTPGSVINEQLGKALGSSFAQLEAADEINEIVNALMIQLIEKTFSSVQGGLRGLSQSKNNQPTALQALQNSASSSTVTSELNTVISNVPAQFQPAVTGGQATSFVNLPTEEEIRQRVELEKQQFCLENPTACQPTTPSEPAP